MTISIETPWANDAPGGTKLNATRLLAYTPLRGSFTNPNGNVVGSPGNTYLNTVGGAGTTLWVKESGVGTNTGWVASGTGTGTAGPAGPAGPQGPAGPTGPAGAAGSGTAITTKDEGVTLTANTTQYDFTGTGVTATAAAGNVTVAIPGGTGINPALITAKGDLIGGTGASAPATIPKTIVNGRVLTFDTTGASPTNIKWADVPYGSAQDEGIALPIQSTYNFIGAGVTATDDSGNLRTNVTIPGSTAASTAIASTWTTTFTVDGGNADHDYIILNGSAGNYLKTITRNTRWALMDGVGNEYYQVLLLVIQDLTGGRISTFPGGFAWVGATVDSFGQPTLNMSPGTLTLIRFTWMGLGNGYLAEV